MELLNYSLTIEFTIYKQKSYPININNIKGRVDYSNIFRGSHKIKLLAGEITQWTELFLWIQGFGFNLQPFMVPWVSPGITHEQTLSTTESNQMLLPQYPLFFICPDPNVHFKQTITLFDMNFFSELVNFYLIGFFSFLERYKCSYSTHSLHIHFWENVYFKKSLLYLKKCQ